MTLLIDDQVLAAHLRGRPVLGAGQDIYTTGYWYVRLCLAVSRRAGGRLSGPFAALPPDLRRATIAAILELPAEIGLLSLRQLGPVIGHMARRHPPMNVLTREAIAAAIELSAEVVVAEGNENPTLFAALKNERLPVTVVAV